MASFSVGQIPIKAAGINVPPYAYVGIQFDGNTSPFFLPGPPDQYNVTFYVVTFVYPRPATGVGGVVDLRWRIVADNVFPITNVGPGASLFHVFNPSTPVADYSSTGILDANTEYQAVGYFTDNITVPDITWQYAGKPASWIGVTGHDFIRFTGVGGGVTNLDTELVSIDYTLPLDGFGDPILNIPPQRF